MSVVSVVVSDSVNNSISFYCNNYGIKKSDFIRIAIQEKLKNQNNVEKEINKLVNKKIKKFFDDFLNSSLYTTI